MTGEKREVSMPSQSAEALREAIRHCYREDEEVAAGRCRSVLDGRRYHEDAADLAGHLIDGARAKQAGGIDSFLNEFGLNTREGIALMCLAEALLRVPDSGTATQLLRDKIGPIDWAVHMSRSKSTFVNAAVFSLMLSGEVIRPPEAAARGLGPEFSRAVSRLGEPVVRRATVRAMQILGGQFVFGRTIDEALKRAKPEERAGLAHSYDMLGEAAMTFADADRYRDAYAGAIDRIARLSRPELIRSPGVSVKLSALHPRYDFLHTAQIRRELLPVLRHLALQARDANIHFTIDAEEADRLELSLDLIAELIADDTLFVRPDGSRWDGFGLAVQAYQKRALTLCDWIGAMAQRHDRRLFVRLVKGAYWDSEIKASQVGGFAGFPVYTRKNSTDLSYLACAARLLAHDAHIYPAFATHNAYTIAAIKTLGAGKHFEFQRLHGMGEEVYGELARLEGENPTLVRIYAPVGGHRELLAYLVRRLLENGANSSFINRMADADLPKAELTRDPVREFDAIAPKHNPAISMPSAIFPGRTNSMGIDLSDPLVREELQQRLIALQDKKWEAGAHYSGDKSAVCSPQDRRQQVGSVTVPTQGEIITAVQHARASQPDWDARGGEARAELLENAADLFEANAVSFLSLLQREAGKTLPDAVLELREAVDFIRYYAVEARRRFAGSVSLPGPTGEENTLRLHGRGVFATISPWNFPLAIFIGPAVAALAAGNSVIAKPAEQTPLTADLAVRLCHQAGIPADVLQLLPGGRETGEFLVGLDDICGVAFTGSLASAKAINRRLAEREGAIACLIAETGGQNAMIVDSTALPEQVVRDVMASAFQSAGQRCSALRILYVQDDIADDLLEMVRGAFEALIIGDPADLATDVGPVIDQIARQRLDSYIGRMGADGQRIWQRDLPESAGHGSFVTPAIIEVDSVGDIPEEQFGPILHVARFAAGGLGNVISQINASGFGLTLGLHSRLESARLQVEREARVGNLYVNRNQIGAVVESQPFGGESLSGTGPKAGGPHYLLRFATERATCVDTTAAGGDARLMTNGAG